METMSHTAKIIGVLLLGCGWSVSTLGATYLQEEDCNEVIDVLQGTETALIALSIDRVDLPGDADELDLVESLNTAESTVPVLYLTPRVASILRNVFYENSADADALEQTPDPNAIVDAQRDSPLPPLAEGSADRQTFPRLEESEFSKESAPTLPRFQRTMYRTDI